MLLCHVFYCAQCAACAQRHPDRTGDLHVHIGEQGSRLGAATVRVAKGQIFVVYLLGIRYHCLVILHLN